MMNMETHHHTKDTQKRASMAFVAQYMDASFTTQRSMVRRAKHAETEFGLLYYQDCRDAVARYLEAGCDSDVLKLKISRLESEKGDTTPQHETLLNHNIRALSEFERQFGNLEADFLTRPRCPLSISDVKIPTTPDLHYTIKGKERFVRLVYSVKPLEPPHLKVFHQLVFTSLRETFISLKPNQVHIVTLHSEETFTCARPSKRLAKNIEAACETISNVWETV